MIGMLMVGKLIYVEAYTMTCSPVISFIPAPTYLFLFSHTHLMIDEDVYLNSCCTYYSVDSFNDELGGNSRNNFLMLHHNIRSFRKNFDEVSAFLSLLSHRFQVLVFSETWFDNDSVMEISGYKSYHSYRSGRVGGGVSVYVSDILRSTCVEELTLNGDIFETCCVKVNHNNEDIYVLGTPEPKNARPLCYYAYFSNGFARCFLGSIESNFFLISWEN